MEDKDLVIRVNGKITKYKCYKKVVKSGGSGGITLPKEFIGKIVFVELKEKK
jgi:putative transposon-encoded protein